MGFVIRLRSLINLTIFITLTRTSIAKPILEVSKHEYHQDIVTPIHHEFVTPIHHGFVAPVHKDIITTEIKHEPVYYHYRPRRSSDSPADNNECKKYKIISARGTGEPQPHPYGYSNFISGVLAAVPDGSNYEVVYPATVDYINGPLQGAADAINFLNEQKTRCPEQIYVLIGYSEGAMVMTKLLANPELPAEKIMAVILYGNPYFKGNEPQNACEAKSGAGVAAFTGVTLPFKFSSITFDCCKIGDLICQSVGTLIPHLAYPGSEDEKEAIKFAVEKLSRK